VTDVDPCAAACPTRAERLRPPPPALEATGHEDHVYLWVTRVEDAGATSALVAGLIAVGEAARVTQGFVATGGLLAKRLPIDAAAIGTRATLVRPDEAEALLASSGAG
jgi:hypothetical protein